MKNWYFIDAFIRHFSNSNSNSNSSIAKNLELTTKKKKSRKPFDFGALDDELGDSKKKETATKNEDGGDNEGDSNKNTEQLDDLADLTDFSGFKKKKKKKKPFNLEELENALPNETGGESELKESPGEEKNTEIDDKVIDDFDLDFSVTKKKKKKKKATFDLPDQDENLDKENEIGDGFDDDLKEEYFNSTAGSGSTNVGQLKWLESDRDYTYDELLEMIYNKIKEKNPESESGSKKKYVMRPPQVLRIGTKKTSFANFLEICKS